MQVISKKFRLIIFRLISIFGKINIFVFALQGLPGLRDTIPCDTVFSFPGLYFIRRYEDYLNIVFFGKLKELPRKRVAGLPPFFRDFFSGGGSAFSALNTLFLIVRPIAF